MHGVRSFPITASGVVGPVNTGGWVELVGWTLRETGGSNPVSVTFHDGGVVGGSIVAEGGVLAGAAAYPVWLHPGIIVNKQLYVAFNGTGTGSLVVYIR